MTYERYIAYALIAIGALALLTRLDDNTGWLWMALAAAGFLAAYVSQRSYGFLVFGCILAGVALGLLLEGGWGWPGTFLLSLGAGFYAIERIEPARGRWPVYTAAGLGALGLLVLLLRSGILGSVWFALILLAAGVYLLIRRQDENTRTAGEGGWIEAPPADTGTAESPAPAGMDENATETVTSPEAPPVVSASRPPPPPVEAPALTADARLRLERLETWRKRQAATEGNPPYLVLNNDSLERIARENPQTLDALSDVKGIGPVKLERYGKEILRVLKE